LFFCYTLVFSNVAWITPAQYLKGEQNDVFQVTFNPSDMNAAGIIYFKDTNTSASYLMSFVASKIMIQWVSGPTLLFFDFVGKI
jgi:hypothetical protein